MAGNSASVEVVAQVIQQDPQSSTSVTSAIAPLTRSSTVDSSHSASARRPFPSAFARSWSTPGVPRPQSILINREPIIQVTVTVPEQSIDDVPDALVESPQATEPPRLGVAGAAMNSRASSLSSDASSSSALSSVCSRATGTSATTPPLCVSFAPLPAMEPRTRKSRRPLGIAARSQLLRQRKMHMQAQEESYYNSPYGDDLRDDIPGGERPVGAPSRPDEEDPFVTLGRALNDATRVFLRRIASGGRRRATVGGEQAVSPQSRGGPPRKSFSLRIRRRANSASTVETAGGGGGGDGGSDSESDDSDDEYWRRRNEDPMTKTIRSEDDPEFILTYDAVMEDDEDAELALAHDEIRSSVVHVVDSDDGTETAS